GGGRDGGGLAGALPWSAQALRYLRRPGQALAEARGAQELIGEGASSQAAWIWHLIGGCHADLGELELATTAHLKAEAMFSLLSDRAGELAEALALAQLHHLLGELDLAQRTYLRALALQQKTADVTALCWAEAGLVDVRTRRGDTAEVRALRGEATTAHDALRAAEAIAASSPGPVAGIRAAIARGTILEAEGDRDGSFKAYGEARASAGAIGARYLEVKAALLATAV